MKALFLMFYNIKKCIQSASLLKEYFYFSVAASASVVFISCYIIWNTYQSYLANIQYQLEIEAQQISQELENIFNDTSRVILFLGRDISKNNKKEDYAFILSVLKKAPLLKINAFNFLSGLSKLDWITPEKYQMLNLDDGVLKTPYKMPERSYLDTCKKTPWKLHLSHPAIGVLSGLWVIPAGMGITNDKAEYMGTIGLGFRIKELTTCLEQHLKHSHTHFLVLNNKHDIMMQSHSEYPFRVESIKNHKISFKEDNSDLENPIEINDIRYSYYYKTPTVPYIVLVGLDKRILRNEFFSIVFPRLLELLGLCLFCIALLYFFRKKIINPISQLSNIAISLAGGNTKVKIPRQSSQEMHNLAKNLLQVIRYVKRNDVIHLRLEHAYALAKSSDEAKEEFLRRVNNELKHPLHFIIWNSHILIKHLKKEISVHISSEKIIEILNKIRESALELQTLTTNILNISEINVKNIVEYCIKVESKSAFLKEVTLKSTHQKDLPLWYADELRFTQIIIGLISLSINYTYKMDVIDISTSIEVFCGKKFLKITIQDNGVALNKEDIIRVSTHITKKSVGQALDGRDISLETIETLVNLHEGQLDISSLGMKGKLITLTFPYKEAQGVQISQDFQKSPQENNVYKLFT